jgi:hypothetical protein
MSVLDKKPGMRCTVNDCAVSVDDVIENAVTHLEYANKSFSYLYEQYFGWLSAPDDWTNSFHEISMHMTAFKFLLDRITDELLAAHGMGSDFHTGVLAVLYESMSAARKGEITWQA